MKQRGEVGSIRSNSGKGTECSASFGVLDISKLLKLYDILYKNPKKLKGIDWPKCEIRYCIHSSLLPSFAVVAVVLEMSEEVLESVDW